jgi:predicted double-glycine peptidase
MRCNCGRYPVRHLAIGPTRWQQLTTLERPMWRAEFCGRICLLGFIAAFLGCASHGPSQVVPMAGVLPGGAAISPHTISLFGQRFVHVVPQHDDFSCGAAAVATILRYAYNRDIGEVQVLRGMLAVSDVAQVRKRGFSMLDIRHYLETQGMQGDGFKVSTDQLYQVRVPVIVLLNINGYEHFVVMRKATPVNVYLADPSLGNRAIPVNSFLHDWQRGIIFSVIGTDYDENNPLVAVERPLGLNQASRNFVPAFNPVSQETLSGVFVAPGFIEGL